MVQWPRGVKRMWDSARCLLSHLLLCVIGKVSSGILLPFGEIRQVTLYLLRIWILMETALFVIAPANELVTDEDTVIL